MSSSAGRRKNCSPASLRKQVHSPALKSQKADDGASVSGILSEMRDMESRLQLHVDELFEKLSTAFNALEVRLVEKIEKEIKGITERVNAIEDRVATIESELDRINKVSTAIEEIRKEIELVKVKENICTVEQFEADAVIFGIPYCESENLKSNFNQVCRYIDYLAPQIRDIFRIRPKSATNSNNTVVVVKFYTAFDRNRTLKAFSEFRRKNRGVVLMRKAGFDCETAFRIYESLNVPSRKILQLAIRQKRDKKFWSVFSLRGKVYVRLQRNSEAIHVPDEATLMRLIN